VEGIPRNAVVLIDGWNLLVRLAGSPEALADPATREEARRRLLDLLEPWAEARHVRVVVAWDGPGPAAPPAGERVRSVGVDPPAEADDWIVHEAARLHRERTPVRVVTRDRGLLARIPRSVASLPVAEVVSDLVALAGGPVRAPHVHGPEGIRDEVPATTGPVDPTRLPRRRDAVAGNPPPPEPALPVPPSPRRAPARTPESPVRDPRAEARRRAAKERKRARWKRAQQRRETSRKRKR